MCPSGFNEVVIELGLGTGMDPHAIETRYMNPKPNPEVSWEWMLSNTCFETAVGCTRLFDLPAERDFLEACIDEFRISISELDQKTKVEFSPVSTDAIIADALRYSEIAAMRARKHRSLGYELYLQETRLGLLALRKVNLGIYTNTARRMAGNWIERLVAWRSMSSA